MKLRARYIVLPLLLGVSCAASGAAAREWRFQVLLNDKPIGHHTFSLAQSRQGLTLLSQARYEVRFLNFTVYRYRHLARETWRDACLSGIEADTDDNGSTSRLRGQSQDDSFVLEGPGGRAELSGCVMTFAYWNPEILQQTRLLNVQTGDYLPVAVERLGNQKLSLSNGDIDARHYRLVTSKFSIELWYDKNDDWVALRSKVEGGRVLRYERQAASDPVS